MLETVTSFSGESFRTAFGCILLAVLIVFMFWCLFTRPPANKKNRLGE